MKKLLIGILFLSLTLKGFSQVPKTLSFQGVLIETSNGQAVQDGNYTFDLSVFSDSTGGTALWNETHSSVPVNQGIYNIILGDSGSPLNLNFDQKYYLEITVSGGPNSLAPETLSPRTELTASGYELNPNLQDLADGSLSGSKVGTGIDAANISSGTIDNARLDADLQDLADGSLSGSKVGTGINAGNISTGTLPLARLSGITSSELSNSAGITGGQILDGTLTSSDISSSADINTNQVKDSTLTAADLSSSAGIASGQISSLDVSKLSGTIGSANLDANLADLSDGSLSGSKVGNGINAGNITTGTLPLARLSGITASQLSGTAGITYGQIASMNASNLSTGTVPLSRLSGITSSQLSSSADITSDQILDGTLTTSDLSISAAITSNQIASLSATKITGIGANYLPKSNGTGLIESNIYDDGIFVGIGGAGSFTLTVNGDIYVSGQAYKSGGGSWQSTSDIRVKTDIKDITNAIETIKKLRPVKFRYSDEWRQKHPEVKDKYYYNFIAQEFQKVFPESVTSIPDTLNGQKTDILTIDTYAAQITAIKAIQEQESIIEQQAKEIKDLKSENQKIHSQVDELSKEFTELKNNLYNKAAVK